MKKGFFAFLAVLTVFAMVMVGCPTDVPDENPGDQDTKVTISFDLNQGNYDSKGAISPITINKGQKPVPGFPGDTSKFSRSGFTFSKWTDTSGNGNYTANSDYEANITLKAQWTDDGTPKFTITFDANLPPGDYSATAPDPVQISQSDAKLSAAQLALRCSGVSNTLTFVNWYEEAAGTNLVTTDTTFTGDSTIFAKWIIVDPDNDVVITFDLNYTPEDGSGKTFERVYDKEGTFAEDKNGDGLPEPERTGWEFLGWWTLSNGQGTQITETTSVTLAAITASTVYGKWQPVGGFVGEEPPEGTDLAGAEKVTLDNAWYVVYRFDLPATGAGSKWGDYANISADYMATPSLWSGTDSRQVRGVRLMGNYVLGVYDTGTNKIGDFNIITGDTSAVKMANRAVTPYDSGGKDANKNAPYIFDDFGIGNEKKGLEQYATQLGIVDGAPWKWFTVTYKIDGSRKNGSYDASNQPGGNDTGPFYFGLGISGEGGGGSTSYIRNVQLVGNTNVPNLKATPLWLKLGDDLYPAFNGYSNRNATAGSAEAYRGMVDGSQPAPVDITPEKIDITVNLNYAGAADPTTVSVFKGGTLGAAFFQNAPERTGGNAFVNWNTAANGNGTTVTAATTFTEATTIYAQWAASITITLSPNYENAPTAATVTIGSGGTLTSTDLASLTREGFAFKEWNLVASGAGEGAAAVTTATTFSADTTIYAIWQDSVTVTFGEGAGAPTVIVVKSVGTLTAAQLAKPTPTTEEEGKTWGGWFKGTSGHAKADLIYTNTTFDSDTTLRPYWYTPGTLIDGISVQGGARVDEDGYIVMMRDTDNAFLGGGNSDSLFTYTYKDNEPPTGATSWKISYSAEVILQIGSQANMDVIGKEGTGWDDATGVNNAKYKRFDTGENSLTVVMSEWSTTEDLKGFGFQYNRYGADKIQIWRIKVANVDFIGPGDGDGDGDGEDEE